MPTPQKHTFYYEEEKKHSVRYNSKPGDGGFATSVYIMKDSLPMGKPIPREIVLTLEFPNS